MITDMKPIQEFSIEELTEELSRRCSPYIFLGQKIEDGNIGSHWFDWGGEDAICYGLCHSLAYYIKKQITYEEEDAV